MKKILLLLIIVIKVSSVDAQQWVVGQPVNQLILPSAFGYSALQGCYPSASAGWSLNVPTVPGIQFALVVKSADPNSMYILPGNDTLNVGDTVKINSGNFMMSLYYFSPLAPTQPLMFDFVATGIPTQAGASYPCNLSMLLFLSNLLICPEGISGNIPASCTVQLNSSLEENEEIPGTINWPSELNNYMISIADLKPNTHISLYTIQGNLVQELVTSNTEAQINLADKASGIYILKMQYGDNVVSHKFNLSGNR